VATLNGISPVLLVADLDRAVTFYRDALGFDSEIHGDPPDFAVASRDAAVILLALASDGERLVPHWQIVDKMVNAYIRVDDADAIYEEVQKRGAPIDYTIYDAPHGFR
jgi:predicted enzyme related to lactoylglutathione lyase